MAGFADTHSAASSDWAGGDGRRRRRPLQCRRSTWELQGEYAARGLISGETLLRQAKTTIANAKKMITVVNNRSELVEKLPESGGLQYTSGKNEGDLDEEVLRALFNWREDNRKYRPYRINYELNHTTDRFTYNIGNTPSSKLGSTYELVCC